MATAEVEKDLSEGRFQDASLMSRPAMLEAIDTGDVIFTGDRQDVKTASVDLRLGPWLWEERVLEGGQRIFNPYSPDDVNRVWGRLWFAPRQLWWINNRNLQGTLAGIDPRSRMYLIPPGTQILCHTAEFIGGASRNVTTMMKARSTSGRCFLEVCRCAGWGDHGYHTRWTMEMNNSSNSYYVPLVVTCRYSQMAFFRTRDLEPSGTDYTKDGKYQEGDTMEQIRRSWTPEMLRPAMYRDREVPRPHEQRIYVRCKNPDCGFDGVIAASEEDKLLTTTCRCGSKLKTYPVHEVNEQVFPLYDICVMCGHVFNKWDVKTVSECRSFRKREEEGRCYPLVCPKCDDGWRHILGGEYEVANPDPPNGDDCVEFVA